MALKPNTQTGTLSGGDHGTNDNLTGTGGPLYGDAFDMIEEARGGNDVLTGAAGLFNGLLGDAQNMFDHTRGGNDVLIGGAGSTADNTMIGDASFMSGHARGGNDHVIGGADASMNVANADGFSMTDYTVGGNDVVIGGDGAIRNNLRGEGLLMGGHAIGGNDVLIGGNGAGTTNNLIGDARTMSDFAVGGNDTLISGTGIDNMTGDGAIITGTDVTFGTDTFVFMPGNNADTITDFRQSDHDQIDLSAFGFDDIGDLNISIISGNTVIDFGGGNSVTLVGFADPLHASDFIF
jgi:Ca2+-binding RTX toxin-like protein